MRILQTHCISGSGIWARDIKKLIFAVGRGFVRHLNNLGHVECDSNCWQPKKLFDRLALGSNPRSALGMSCMNG